MINLKWGYVEPWLTMTTGRGHGEAMGQEIFLVRVTCALWIPLCFPFLLFSQGSKVALAS